MLDINEKVRPEEAHRPDDARLDRVIEMAKSWLWKQQQPSGFWVGKLESNACMEAEWLLAFHVMGINDHPLKTGLVKRLLQGQRDDGAWEIYYDAPHGDINATVESYTALRASGLSASHPKLVKAREWIFAHGGLKNIRVFTRFWLALIGEWPWNKTPALPPEIIYFPLWFPFNIYHFACWARATIVPLCILSHRQAVTPLAEASRLDELFPDGRHAYDYSLPPKAGAWAKFFFTADKFLKTYRRLFKRPPLRENAIKRCCEWIIKHQDADGSWGGIQPPWVYSLMALHGEGYPLTHTIMAKGIDTLMDHWSYERDGAVYIQACESPVWDTLLSLLALIDSDETPEKLHQAIDWIIDQQVLAPGDWQVKLPALEPGGWAFERANIHYPDIDDTAVALIVLARARAHHNNRRRLDQAIERGRIWLLAMQCKNGGWGAFDKDNNKEILTKIPFSDFGETIDPPSVDVTAHVLEAFGHLGMRRDHPAVARGLNFIWQEQELEGSWFGRWGVNHIYGTAAVLPALEALDEDMLQPAVIRACDWIAKKQNPDGGWGESCASYMDDSLRGRGPSTASQTGWAIMCLLSCGDLRYRAEIQKGARFLASRQNAQGSWDEPQFTGTGFPGYGVGQRIRLSHKNAANLQQNQELGRGFMINYTLYRHYFPLMALGRMEKAGLKLADS